LSEQSLSGKTYLCGEFGLVIFDGKRRAAAAIPDLEVRAAAGN
jgi:hypothetical protein